MGSTIAEAGLNFRVRNGNGCGPCSMDGGKTVYFRSSCLIELFQLSDPIRSDPIRSDPIRSDPIRSDPIRSRSGDARQAWRTPVDPSVSSIEYLSRLERLIRLLLTYASSSATNTKSRASPDPILVKPHERLVSVSFTHCCASTSDLSNSSSWSALQGTEVPGRSRLEAGFPLRCFQRLSDPNLATRLCHWRDNRSTIGSSIPVLSY